jgi:hypothetical protein
MVRDFLPDCHNRYETKVGTVNSHSTIIAYVSATLLWERVLIRIMACVLP